MQEDMLTVLACKRTSYLEQPARLKATTVGTSQPLGTAGRACAGIGSGQYQQPPACLGAFVSSTPKIK